MITERERQILAWIRENPSITQKELAEKAHISRSSVAVHISNLMHKGAIRGRRYVLEESPYIVSVGASRVDVIGWPESLRPSKATKARQASAGLSQTSAASARTTRLSNISPALPNASTASARTSAAPFQTGEGQQGILRTVASGTAYNIAHSLAHLDCPVRLVTAFGDDDEGKRLIADCQHVGIDISASLTARGIESASQLFLTQPDGTRRLILRDSRVFDLLAPDFLAEHLLSINRAALCVVESSLATATRNFLWKNVQIPLAYVYAAADDSLPTEADLSHAALIKLDQSALERLVGRSLFDLASIKQAATQVLSRGALALFVALADGGVLCVTQGEELHLPWVGGPLPPSGEFQDVLASGIIWGWTQGFTAKKCAQAGLVAAAYHANARGATRLTLDSKSLRARLDAETHERRTSLS